MFRGFAQRSGDSTPGRANVKLRHQAISFVSAGTNTPAEPDSTVEEEDITIALGEDDDDEEEDEEDDVQQAQVQDQEQQGEQDIQVEDLDEAAILAAATADAEAYVISRGTRDMQLNGTANNANNNTSMDVEMTVDEPAALATPAVAEPSPPAEPASFIIDTEGDPEVAASFKQKAKIPVRASSPTPSDSSEEVVLFRGRNKKASVVDDPYSKPKPQKRSVPEAPANADSPAPVQQQEAHVTDDLLAALNATHESSTPATGWATRRSPWKQQEDVSEDGFTAAPPGSWWHKKGMPRPDLPPSQAEKEALDSAASNPRATKVGFAVPGEEEDGAAETIASLQADWNRTKQEKKRAKQAQQELDQGAPQDDEQEASQTRSMNRALSSRSGPKMNRRGKRGRKRANKLLRDLQSDDSDDEEAAYEDYMQNLKAQLEDGDSEIEGIVSADGGPSLVVDGKIVPEDQVLDAATREINWEESRILGESSADSDDDTIGEDLSALDDSEDDMNASEFDSSDLEQELEYNEREQWEDEADLRQRRIEAMDDEHIARLFAKQQALGIQDDELVIDDGAFMDMDEVEGFGDLDEARSGLADLANMSFGSSTNKRRSNKRGGRGGFSFPDASALADSVDQYGDVGFDIMDFDRPSLRNTKRGRKGKLPPELEELSDEDLREEMRSQWDNDRDKKRLKKAEREELRMQGMLGAAGKKGKADLSQKYLQGMTVPQIHEELKIFLMDDGKTTRSFPPMDKHDRKSLHEIANALNLKSKSVGTGKNRAPVLYKTSRTVDYSEHTFTRITNAANRGFLKNSAFKSKKPKGAAMRGPRGGKGGGVGGTGLRDGEIVGAGAKEIGRENFGHRLMEKMGWAKGQALGREGEGRLIPVEQVMKAGRGGLG